MELNKVFLSVIIVVLSFASLVFSHSGDTLYVPYGIQPTIDGQILPGEWDDADTVLLPLPEGPAVVFYKQNPDSLYIAINLTDSTYDNFDNATIRFDCNHNGGNAPQPDDYGFGSHRGGMLVEFYGTGAGWNQQAISGWNGAIYSSVNYWEVEYSISFDKLGIIPGVAKTLGFEVWAGDVGNGGGNWPPGANGGNPNSWGDIVSPDNWASLDTIPPWPPSNITANGSNPSPWTNNPKFEINWINPPDSSGIKRALYKLSTYPDSNYDTTGSMSGAPPDSATATSEGGQALYLWLEDNAGNTDFNNNAQVVLRYDGTPPSGSKASSPLYSTSLQFTVNWTAGNDTGGSGLSGNYDVKVKVGNGSWTDWLTNYTGLSAVFAGADGNKYYFEAGAIDSAGNIETFNGVPECSTIVDTTKPSVVSTYPVDGDTGIAPNTDISATFSEQMDSTSMISTNFLISGSTSGTHTFTIDYNSNGFTVYLNPDSDFNFSEIVTVTVKKEVADLAGNMMPNDKIWSFSTGAFVDTLGPTTSSGSAVPPTPEPIANLKISAFVSDVDRGNNIIQGAEFFVDTQGSNGSGYIMFPSDTFWDEISEDVKGKLDTKPLGWVVNDTHLVFIHGMDAVGNWGGFDTVRITVKPDDDTIGPIFSNFTPGEWPDTSSFYIECQIVDPSGVYDDSTGSGGQGVYLLWDDDGEIAIDANEVTMSLSTGSYYKTDFLIPIQEDSSNFVYEVYAYDNDFDTEHPGDRTQGLSGLQSINIIDVRGPRTEDVKASPNPTYGANRLVLTAVVTDSLLGYSTIYGSECFIDSTGYDSTGITMLPLDGIFDEITEDVLDTLDISNWEYGTTKWLYVHGLDSSGNWGGFDSVLVYVTAVQDTILPYIVSTSPDSGETGVSFNRNIFITFSEPMNIASLDTSKFDINGSINPIYSFVMSYDSLTYSVKLNPDSFFAQGETITVDISQSVTDTAGNWMLGPYSFFFITGTSVDTVGPVVTLKSAYPDTTEGAHYCTTSATISDSTSGMSVVKSAETFIDSMGSNGSGQPMFVSDSLWDEIIEDVYSQIDISSLGLGIHWIYLHGYDDANNWGLFDSLYIVITPDDDTIGPTFSNFRPDSVPDTSNFYIYCVITDTSGVYDDSTGSGGQGVYLLWDNDGELVISSSEMRMSSVSGDTFRTDYRIQRQSKDANFVYEVFAYDNDFDFNEKEDRTQSQSSIQNIVIYDDRGPITKYVYVSPPNPPAGISEVVLYATVSDSLTGNSITAGAEAFLDSIGATGSGFSMQALDGVFDEKEEDVFDTIPVSGWQAGETHKFYVHGKDEYNNWGGFDSASIYVTEVVDTVPPWIAFTSPDSGEIGVTLNTWIFVTFTERVDPSTVTSDKILIEGDIGGIYNFWMSYNDLDSTLSINPYNDFAPLESINVYIASGIQDLVGNPMVRNYWWWFRTGEAADTIPPVVDTMSVEPDTVWMKNWTLLSGTVSDNKEVSNAEYFIDSIGIDGTGFSTIPVDSFGAPSVDIFDTIFTDTLSFGTHIVYLHGIDGSGNWGNCDSISFFIGGEDTIGPQFDITINPSPAYIGDSVEIIAVPNEPLHPDSAVLCSITTIDGSSYTLTLLQDTISYANKISSVGFTSGICNVKVSGFDIWDNWGSSETTFNIGPKGEFLPEDKVYAWPNPAREDRVYFHFYVNANADVTVDVFNLEGERVVSLKGKGEGGKPPHQQSSNAIIWDISKIASDIYIFRIYAKSEATGEKKSVIKKLAIVK